MSELNDSDNREPAPEPASDPSDGQRLAKVMARAGLCSRRDAERWIADARVRVNGALVTSPALNVTARDVVEVDGKPLPKPEQARLWRYHKPGGLVTTSKDDQGRPTVFDALPAGLPRVIAVGRLDLNSEGLLLLTNDGELARRLELPETGLRRIYRVRVRGIVLQQKLDQLRDGVTVEGVRYGVVEAELENQQTSNAWLQVTLTEGKNREVRRVLEHVGYVVNRLIRIGYGPLALGDLPRGAVAEVPPVTVRRLMGRPHKGAKAKVRNKRPRPSKAAGGKPSRGGPRGKTGAGPGAGADRRR